MANDYNKPFKSIAEQRGLLEARGLWIEDTAEAEYYLRHEGYYRLSAYWHPFRKIDKTGQRSDTFADNANFSDVIQLYEFDKWLRALLLGWLRGIEISVRVAIAHELGEKDIFAHENPHLLSTKFTKNGTDRRNKTGYEIWLDKYHHLLSRNGKEDFVQLFMDKYGTKIPIWVAVEIWDFGLLARFFEGMKFEDQQAVSLQYGVKNPQIFASWLNAFNHARNISAHHSRLWNKTLLKQPHIPNKGEMAPLDHLNEQWNISQRTYAILAIAAHILRTIEYRAPWRETFRSLLEKFPQCTSVSLQMMGVPANWEQLPLWQIK